MPRSAISGRSAKDDQRVLAPYPLFNAGESLRGISANAGTTFDAVGGRALVPASAAGLLIRPATRAMWRSPDDVGALSIVMYHVGKQSSAAFRIIFSFRQNSDTTGASNDSEIALVER
jgi:hypothetical protein